MIGGFALVAYPAEYGNSGIMTFMINHDGDVYEKDLGSGTAQLAARMTSFNPDHTWKKVVDTENRAGDSRSYRRIGLDIAHLVAPFP